jgi:DNA-binding transcriptional LysR family regulator
MDLEFKHIRALAAIKQHESFRRAAQSLNTSAPGLTKTIQVLERRLGVDLVDRNSRPVSLTKYGQAVHDHGLVAVDSIEHALHQIEIMKGLEQAELAISTSAFFSVAIAGQAVADLIPRYPGVHFHINSEAPRDAVIHFEQRRTNFFIGTEGELTDKNNVQTIELPFPDIAYIIREGHPLLLLPEIRLIDCLEYPLLGPRLPTWWEEYFRDWVLGIGVPLPEGYETTSPYHRGQSTDWGAVLMLCRACDGIVGGCRSQMERYENGSGFVIFEPVDAPPKPNTRMMLAWHNDTPMTTVLKDTIVRQNLGDKQNSLPSD